MNASGTITGALPPQCSWTRGSPSSCPWREASTAGALPLWLHWPPSASTRAGMMIAQGLLEGRCPVGGQDCKLQP